MKEFVKAAADILYPPRCPVCHGIVNPRSAFACEACLAKLHRIRAPRCFKCGKEMEQEGREFCPDCCRGDHSFDQGISVFRYDDLMRGSVAAFKFHNKREYAEFYGMELAAALEPFLGKWNPQVCVPVPLHRKKRKSRGYNQAELLALQISRRCEIPVRFNLVERIKETSPQKELGRKKRKNNLKNAFKIKEHDVELKRVLLVDDIYTTGSTIDAISEILRGAGVKEIYFAVLCSGKIC